MSKMAVVVGLGFAGSVIARSLAEAGFEVTALEKRPHVAGNMYEHTRLNGVRVHNYGPHIFHTNNQQVYDYLKRFSDFYPYSHRVVGWIDGKLVPIPFNYTSIDSLFAPAKAAMLKDKLTKAFPGKEKCFISELVEHTDPDIKSLGNYIMDRVFVHYTAKQWGVPVEEVDKSVIDRVPVVLGTDDRYFRDTIQMMPIHGFTELFENMLSHPKINVQTNSDAMLRLALHESSGNILLDGAPFNGPVCYTGAIDELFNNEFGVLPYRSTNLVFEDIEKESYQSNSVINYPNSEEFTRITEF
ncbi:MAG TPA: UDP-galactopyranose mutase, partial [Bacillota bacterium]|nr:UDP-galactopyranose mutase [Bacillota bacterium]